MLTDGRVHATVDAIEKNEKTEEQEVDQDGRKEENEL